MSSRAKQVKRCTTKFAPEGRFLIDPGFAPHGTSVSEVRHNLPATVTSFIGREREVREIHHALKATRLLTLTGIGGSGKTRLALEAAELLLARYEDGTWLVELGSITDPGLIPEAIAHVFGISAEQQKPIQTTLSRSPSNSPPRGLRCSPCSKSRLAWATP